MKKLIIASAIMAAAGSASADAWFEDCKPVVGLDFKWARIKNSAAWDNLFPKNFPGATVYIGTKFTENFGAELGYSSTFKKTKNVDLAANTSVGGANVPAAVGLHTKVRFSGPYLDLVGFLPLENCWDVFASVGIGWVNSTLAADWRSGAIVGSSNFNTELTSITGHNKAILRVGLGANWMVTDVVGLRIKGLFENTAKVHVKSNVAEASRVLTNRKAWKDSYSLSAGVFFKF